MPAVSYQGCHCTGHDCFPPRESTSGSDFVFIEGEPVLRQGDRFSVHHCGDNAHSGSVSGGSDFVFIEGVPIARIGDAVSCGSAIAKGSDFVFSE